MHKQNGIYTNKILTFGSKINLGNTLKGSCIHWVGAAEQLFLRASSFGARFCEKRQTCKFSGPIMEVMCAEEGGTNCALSEYVRH